MDVREELRQPRRSGREEAPRRLARASSSPTGVPPRGPTDSSPQVGGRPGRRRRRRLGFAARQGRQERLEAAPAAAAHRVEVEVRARSGGRGTCGGRATTRRSRAAALQSSSLQGLELTIADLAEARRGDGGRDLGDQGMGRRLDRPRRRTRDPRRRRSAAAGRRAAFGPSAHEAAGVPQDGHEHGLLGVERVAEAPVGHASQGQDDHGPLAVRARPRSSATRTTARTWRRRRRRAAGSAGRGFVGGHGFTSSPTTSISTQHPSRASPLTSRSVLTGLESAKKRFRIGGEFLEVGHVGEEGLDLDDVGEAHAGGLEDGADQLEHDTPSGRPRRTARRPCRRGSTASWPVTKRVLDAAVLDQEAGAVGSPGRRVVGRDR